MGTIHYTDFDFYGGFCGFVKELDKPLAVARGASESVASFATLSISNATGALPVARVSRVARAFQQIFNEVEGHINLC